jgi:septum formation protein
MVLAHLSDTKIILASKSPRRQELLKGLGITFEVKTQEVDESYPDSLENKKVAEYLAQKKANFFQLKSSEILITSDTTVLLENQILNKPKNAAEAEKMLNLLSDKSHHVITGVCLKSLDKEMVFSETTKVSFKKLTKEEVQHYVQHYKPFDKAGAYGIQEWMGYIGIKQLEGCYYNVMGLPLSRLYQELLDF